MPILELLPQVELETLTPPILETDSTTLPLELEFFRQVLENNYTKLSNSPPGGDRGSAPGGTNPGETPGPDSKRPYEDQGRSPGGSDQFTPPGGEWGNPPGSNNKEPPENPDEDPNPNT